MLMIIAHEIRKIDAKLKSYNDRVKLKICERC